MCDRKYGVGADGLIIIEKTLHADLRWYIIMRMVLWEVCAVMEHDVLCLLKT